MSSMASIGLVATGAVALLAMPSGAAETSRASLAVSATVVPVCSVGLAPAPAGTVSQRAATSCTAGFEPVLTVERGSGGGGGATETPDDSAREDRGIVYLTLTY